MTSINTITHAPSNFSTVSTTTDGITSPGKDCGEIANQHNAILGLRQSLRSEIKEYTQLRPWISYVSITSQWAAIAATMAIAVHFSHFLVWLVAVIIIAGRQHALMVLGHEASHHRISPNKVVNDFVGEVFCFLPVFFNLRRWGDEHLQHHRQINTDQDPYVDDFTTYDEWQWPKKMPDALLLFLKDCVALNSKTNFAAAKRWSAFTKRPIPLNRSERTRTIIFSVLLLITLTLSNGWWVFFSLWIFPLLTLTTLFMRIRTIAEHLGIADEENAQGIDATRHVNANWLERMTICPFAINYHLAHHIFPSVPFYNLPKFHQRLLKEELYQKHGRIKQGYFGKNSVFKEVLTQGS